jgi:hypothetical protein
VKILARFLSGTRATVIKPGKFSNLFPDAVLRLPGEPLVSQKRTLRKPRGLMLRSLPKRFLDIYGFLSMNPSARPNQKA